MTGSMSKYDHKKIESKWPASAKATAGKHYDPKAIENKWQLFWERDKTFEVTEDETKKKFYVLDMFPYPSGAGLHVGHPKGYIATDVMARMKMMQGFNVLHPMGWDAFGLPAENYAIANKVHPSVATAKNIETFKKQLGLLGFTYDWEREVNTTDPNYYKWTQWAFIQMFKRGLAYESFEPINWCPTCQTGLANEDLEDGKCERCGTLVERKPLRQWVLKITDYAERLLNDIDKLEQWPEPIKEMQRNWIGKSEGAEINFRVMLSEVASDATKSKHPVEQRDPSPQGGAQDDDVVLTVFTTRPDTLFGVTYMVVAPEHPLLGNNELGIKNYDEVLGYIAKAKNKSDLERTELQKEKTGVELKGVKAVNPVNGEEIPIFVADYVLMNYGTGAIMAVPAHDERDFEFAKKFGLLMKEVVVEQVNSRFSDSEPRRIAIAIVENDKGEILIQSDTRNNKTTYCLPGGGVDEGEDIREASLREIKEETGYIEFESIKKVGTLEANYYNPRREINRQALATCFSMKLKSNKKIEVQFSETEKQGLIKHSWLSKEEAMKVLSSENASSGEDLALFKRYLKNKDEAFSNLGVVINSDFLNGLETRDAKEKMIQYLEEKNIGKRKVQYKLRDWVFSRQRYWGEPIPLVHCENCENKKYNYIFIHGFSSSSERGFKPWLKEELENRGHKVWNPDLPNTNNPSVNEQAEFILKNSPFAIDDNLVLVGHSLGGPAIYRILESISHKIARAVLVDPVVRPRFNDQDRPEVVASCDWKFNWKKIKNNCQQFIILGDINRPIIKKEHLIELEKNLSADLWWVTPRNYHFSSRNGAVEDEPTILKAAVANGWIPVPEKDLPLELPKVENYEPSGTGESPLANIEEWVNTKCPVCGGHAKRETNTMPQWAGSCWYYLRYCDPKNKKELINKEKEKYWNPVDLYVGGAEHATRHLIYARFWHKFLYDIGVVSHEEPFIRLQNVGLILAEDGRKMSKRWNNVINPDDVVAEYGADAMRLYEMFMGPFDQPVAWSTQGVVGMRRFLEKVWALKSKVHKVEKSVKSNIDTLLHQTIKKVSEDIEAMRYNTAISQMMILVNEMIKEEKLFLTHYSLFLQLLSPFAPHIAEELWSELGNKESIFKFDWPKYDPALIQDEKITIAVQVNGKLRDTFDIPVDMSEEEIKKLTLSSEKVQKWLEGKEPKKVIYVKGRLVSVVV